MLPADCHEKLIVYQHELICTHSVVTQDKCIMHMKFNFPFFADQHYSFCKRITFSSFKTTGHEQLIISLTFLVLPDGKKHHGIYYMGQKELSERKLSSGIIFKCNEKGWMIEIMFECLREFWGRRRNAFLKKITSLVLDAFKCHQKKWKLYLLI